MKHYCHEQLKVWIVIALTLETDQGKVYREKTPDFYDSANIS